MQSILSLIQERNHNKVPILSKNRLKEENDALGSKAFIVTYNCRSYINGVLLTKNITDYTNAISDPQIQMMFRNEAVPKAFIAVSHTKLFTAYQGIYKNGVLSLFDTKTNIAPKTEIKVETSTTSISSSPTENSESYFSNSSPVHPPNSFSECQPPPRNSL
jgi:hypothetical protein